MLYNKKNLSSTKFYILMLFLSLWMYTYSMEESYSSNDDPSFAITSEDEITTNDYQAQFDEMNASLGATLPAVKLLSERKLLLDEYISHGFVHKNVREQSVYEKICSLFYNPKEKEKVEVKPFLIKKLPVEIRQHILSFLPGKDRGLNYLIRHKKFEPTLQVMKKIQRAFLLQLNNQCYSLSEPVAYAALHFFETTQYKKSLLNSFSQDIAGLDNSIPHYEKPTWWGSASVEAMRKLDKDVINSNLDSYIKATSTQWNSLHEESKQALSFSDFCAIRVKILRNFTKRLENYQYDPPCNVGVLIPSAGCLACAGISTAISCALCNTVPITAAVIGSLGGCGCATLSLVNFGWGIAPSCEDSYIQDPCDPRSQAQKELIDDLKESVSEYIKLQRDMGKANLFHQ